jgi:hypothetical protein
MCRVYDERTIGSEIILMHPMVLLGDVGQVEARFSPLEIVLILVQDRCIVCTECTMGMEIILGTPDGTPSQVEAHFGPFGDSVNLSTRLLHGLL